MLDIREWVIDGGWCEGVHSRSKLIAEETGMKRVRLGMARRAM